MSLGDQLIRLMEEDDNAVGGVRDIYEEAVCKHAANIADMIVRDGGLDPRKVEIVVRRRGRYA